MKESWSKWATEVSCLYWFSVQSCTQNWLFRKFVVTFENELKSETNRNIQIKLCTLVHPLYGYNIFLAIFILTVQEL